MTEPVPGPGPGLSGAAVPISSVPALSSRPGAPIRIYLDFNGEAGFNWDGFQVPTTPAFSIDTDLLTFSDQEQTAISEVWSRVSEKYSPFNIDVTTVRPSGFADGQAVHVIIGGSGGWVGGGGGIAARGSFSSPGMMNVSFVFPDNLAKNAKYIGEASAHEAGHMFALAHQSSYSGSTLTAEYNQGNAQKAPTMGNSYYATRGLWWNGQTSSSTTFQDDLSIITHPLNQITYRTDDFGNSIGAATTLTLSGTSYSAAGVITQTSDSDFFSFNVPATGAVTIGGAIAQFGGMLDMSLELYNSSGTLVTAAATSSLGESISTSLSAGTYFVAVKSAGNYGDIGQFSLAISVPSSGGSGQAAPVAIAGGPYSMAEGGSLVLSGANSTGTGLIYTWDLDGDGVFGETGSGATRGSETGSSVTLGGSGLDGPSTYNVQLRVTDSIGQVSTVTVPVSVTDVLQVVTLGGATSGVEGTAVTINFNATDAGGANDPTTSWIVTWGDGTTSTYGGSVTSGTKTYSDNGSYTVRVTSVNKNASVTATQNMAIANVAPTLALALGATRQEGTPVSLNFTATDPGTDTVSGWVVEWGDGTTSTYAGNVSSANKTYGDNGSYSIRVTATDEDGSHQSTTSVAIANVAPTLSVSGSASPVEGSAFTLNWSKIDPGADTVSSWVVEWGDGTTSTYAGTVLTGTKTYADNGTYTVRLTAVDEDGSYQTTTTAAVANVAPTLSVSGSASPTEGSAFTLNFSRTDPGTDTVANWIVEWGDGTTNTYAGTATSATKTFADNGSFTVRLTALDEDGSYLATLPVAVANVAPTLSVSGSASPTEGSAFTLNFSRTDPGTDTVSGWIVEWGDGTTSTYAGTATSATKTFADNGSYSVRITATDEDGSYQTTLPVSVSNVAPVLTVSATSSVQEGSPFTLNFGGADVGSDSISGWVVTWGDGTTSTYAGSVTSATKTYADDGNYSVRVTATDEDGSYQATLPVAVANVVPTLTVSSPSAVVAGAEYRIDFSSSDPGADTVSSWWVEWGDGTSAVLAGTATSATKVYAAAGDYTVVVRATDEDGTYSANRALTVSAAPVAISLTGSSFPVEGGVYTLGFGASSAVTVSVTGWTVTWGDGTTSTYAGSIGSATKVYADNGVYTARVTAVVDGQSYSGEQSVSVANSAPVLTVNASATRVEGTPLTLSWSATDAGADTISGWKVEWGDGTTSTYAGTTLSGTKTYADNGSYTVRLTATDEDGSYLSTLPLTVSNVAPTVSVSASATRVEGSAVTFNWGATDPGTDTVSGWTVEWGDGTTSTYAGNVLSGTKTFADNGSYTVRVTATDEDGAAQATLPLTISNSAPTLSVSASATRVEGTPVTLTWGATDAGTDTVSGWTVEWGDGSTSTYAGNVLSGTKTFADNGSYTVRVTATDEDGSYQSTLPLTITNSAPTLTLAASATRVEGTAVTFNWGAADAGTDTVSSWRLEWGDGQTSTYTGGVLSGNKTFTDNGTYSVRLTATDEDGSYQTTLAVTIANAAPTLTFTAGATRLEGSPVTFSWSRVDPGADTISSWTVEWGDGQTSTFAGSVLSGSKTFADNGTYSVRLTATDEDGSYQTTLPLTVANVAPTLSMSAGATRVEGSPVTLTWSKSDPGTDTVSGWTVEWGDGTTGTYAGNVLTANKTYADNGSYTVRLTAIDEDGSFQQTLPLTIANVVPTLTVSGSVSPTEGSPFTLSFGRTDPGTDTVSAWKVEWGDGTTSTYGGTTTSAVKTYADNGSYSVRVTATDEDGSYQTTLPVSVANVAPVLTVSAGATRVEGSPVTVSFSRTDAGADTVSAWKVEWGDGTTSTYAGSASAATKTYTDNGSYTVRVTATDEDGSYLSTLPLTIADVAPTLTVTGPSTVVAGANYQINFSATDPGTDTISGWLVTWGDGTTSTYAGSVTSATRVYSAAGTYSVQVQATNEDGSFAVTRSVEVSAAAVAVSASSSPNAREGSPLTLTFSASSAVAISVSGWLIDWGDGTTSTLAGNATSATKTYADNGNYTVTTTATVGGQAYSTQTLIAVANVAPVLTASVPAGLREGNAFTLSFGRTDVGTDTVSGWVVEWGDGTTGTYTGTATSAVKTYSDNGSYTIRVTATDEDGSYLTTVAAAVANVSPTLAVSGSTSPTEGSPFTLSFSRTDVGTDTISAWKVEWGDGTTSTYAGTATSGVKTYADNGSYNVRVTATDEDGSYQSTLPVSVANVAPLLSLTVPTDLKEGVPFTLGFTATDPGVDTRALWRVEWGDGTTSTYAGNATSGAKTYADDGNYTLRVTAIDDDGSWTVSRGVNVAVVGPTITLSAPDTSRAGETYVVNFSASGVGVDTILSWTVDWGDGTSEVVSGTATSASRVWESEGVRTIRVAAVDSDGVWNSAATSVAVAAAPLPIVSVVAPADTVAGWKVPVQLSFTDVIGRTATSWAVSWNNGTTWTIVNPAVGATAPEAGEYSLLARVMLSDGSTATGGTAVHVFSSAELISVSSPATVVVGGLGTVQFGGTGVSAVDRRGWRVQWSDGLVQELPATATSAARVLGDELEYSVVVTSINGGGEIASVESTVNAISASPTLTVSGQLVAGTEASFALNLDRRLTELLRSWRVEWGNGAEATLDSAGRLLKYAYPSSGSFVARVVAIFDGGTEVSADVPLTVNAQPNMQRPTWSQVSRRVAQIRTSLEGIPADATFEFVTPKGEFWQAFAGRGDNGETVLQGTTSRSAIDSDDAGPWKVVATFGGESHDLGTVTADIAGGSASLTTTAASLALPRSVILPGSELRATARVAAGGAGISGATRVTFYLSSDDVWDNSDVSLASSDIRSRMTPNSTRSLSAKFRIPAATAPGSYQILAVADSGEVFREANENDNVRVAGQVNVVPPIVDLSGSRVVGVTTGKGGNVSAVRLLLRNLGNTSATNLSVKVVLRDADGNLSDTPIAEMSLGKATLSPNAQRALRLVPKGVIVPPGATLVAVVTSNGTNPFATQPVTLAA